MKPYLIIFLFILSIFIFGTSLYLAAVLDRISPVDGSFVICEDSDSGVNEFLRGIVSLKYSNSLSSKFFKQYEDYCLDGSTLLEYSCLKNSFSAKKISCDKGCLRGRCLSSGPEVYFVLAVDTEAYIEDSTLNDYSRRYDFSNYDGPSSITGSLFDSDLRFNKLDSYGDPFKLTWYLYTSEDLCEGINTDCNSIYSSLTENWKNELDFYFQHLGL